jgi:hypothetical protein
MDNVCHSAYQNIFYLMIVKAFQDVEGRNHSSEGRPLGRL